MGYGFGARGRKVKSRDCALASDLVKTARVAGACQCPDKMFFDGRRASKVVLFLK